MSKFYCFWRLALKFYFKLFHHHQVYGLEHIPTGRALLASNHTSYYDPILIAISIPEEVSFITQSSLFTIPIFGKFIHLLNAYPVSNSTNNLSSFKLTLSLLNEEKKVVIFPEGERSDMGEITDIQPGLGLLAFRTKAPIVPVYIKGAFEIWSKNRTFPKLWGKTVVIFGAPIILDETLDKKKQMEEITLQLKNQWKILSDRRF